MTHQSTLWSICVQAMLAWLTEPRFLAASLCFYLNSHLYAHTVFIQEFYHYTLFSTESDNQGLLLCTMILTFVLSVRELGSKLWILVLGFCRNHKQVDHNRSLYSSSMTKGPTLEGFAASHLLSVGQRSCWLPLLPQSVVLCSSNSWAAAGGQDRYKPRYTWSLDLHLHTHGLV